MLRLELLNVKKELGRELETLALNCSKVRPRCALGLRARHIARTLGAPGASAAWQAGSVLGGEVGRSLASRFLLRYAAGKERSFGKQKLGWRH